MLRRCALGSAHQAISRWCGTTAAINHGQHYSGWWLEGSNQATNQHFQISSTRAEIAALHKDDKHDYLYLGMFFVSQGKVPWKLMFPSSWHLLWRKAENHQVHFQPTSG